MLALGAIHCPLSWSRTRCIVRTRSRRAQCVSQAKDYKGTPFEKSFADLASTLAGGKSAANTVVERLAAEIGKEVYIDIASWHLYLRDTPFAESLAVEIASEISISSNDCETVVMDVLKRQEVKLGGGKRKVALLDLVPAYCIADLVKIAEDFADQI